jgi:FSR family fosmidomycin resistance protein-like MFS transporter
MLLAVPGFVGALIEPLFGILGDAGHRRRVIVGGGAMFVLALALASAADDFVVLLVAFAVLGPASGAFVSLSQASFMDADPAARERNMARWVVAGSVGVVLGPLVLGAAVWSGFGWRGAFLGLAIAIIPLLVAAAPSRSDARPERSIADAFRSTARALRDVEVLRWLALLELTDLMGDVFLGYLALYFVDVAGATPAVGGLAVAVLGLAGLGGDALLLAILRRTEGEAWLRAGAVGALVAYPAFLLAPWIPVKLAIVAVLAVLRAGWYAIPQARLFDELHGSSGAAVAVSNVGGLAASLMPLGLGALATRAGLGTAMWVAMAAPIALLTLLPRRPRPPAEPRTSPGGPKA